MPDDALVTIAEFENSFDANLAKTILDSAGIQSVLLGEHLVANMICGIPSITIELQVRESDAVQAKHVLAEEQEMPSGEQ